MWVGRRAACRIDLVLHPVVNRDWTLSRDNHLKVNIQGKVIPMHQIPNFQAGMLGSHFRLMVFFPRMRRQHGNRWVNFVDTKYYMAWYDKVVRPALKAVLGPARLQHYPLECDSTTKLSRTARGQLRFPTYTVPRSRVPELFAAIRDADNADLPQEMRGWFYHIYAKDLKLVLSSADGDILSNFWTSKMNPFDDTMRHEVEKQLVFDVAVELTDTSAPSTLLWNGPKLEAAFKSAGFVERMSDLWCGIRDIAGMRGTMSQKLRGNNHILWAQFYHLDKNPLHSKSNQCVGKPTSPEDVHLQTIASTGP